MYKIDMRGGGSKNSSLGNYLNRGLGEKNMILKKEAENISLGTTPAGERSRPLEKDQVPWKAFKEFNEVQVLRKCENN